MASAINTRCLCVCVGGGARGSLGATCINHDWIDTVRKMASGQSMWMCSPETQCLCVCVFRLCVCVQVCLSGEVSSRHQQHFSPVSSGLASLCTKRLMNRSVHSVCFTLCDCAWLFVYMILLRKCPDAACFLLSQGPWISWWPWVHLMQLGRGALPPLNKVLSRRSLCSRCSKHHKTLNTEHRGGNNNFHVFSLCTQACTMPEMKQTIEQTLVVSVELQRFKKLLSQIIHSFTALWSTYMELYAEDYVMSLFSLCW